MINLNKFAVLLFMLFVLIHNSCNLTTEDESFEQMSLSEIRYALNNKFKTGVPKENVVKYLMKNRIEFSEQHKFNESIYGEENVEWISAYIRQKSFFHRNYKILIEFYFHKTNKTLVRIEVEEIYNSL